MTRRQFNQYIADADFKNLFITEMCWNRYHGQADILPFTIDDVEYKMTTIAERNGFQIITCKVSNIPSSTLCKKIDFKLRKYANDYVCIFYIEGTEHNQWVAPIKTIDKRELVLIEYETAEKADFLFSKMDSLSFDIGETTTIVDVRARIQGAFSINSEKITKDFYTGFRKEHKAFAEFITGIDDHIEVKENRNKQWYTSVMLNRLMFCYFIQKKGFLDGDYDYLQHKLKWVRQEQGENRFFKSFYSGFLSDLFHDGLNAPLHDAAFEEKYGRIPYLNGGMFDEHQLEQDYANIDICDDAFVRLFNFFDTWRWHLDTRITASGKDINPDVLGYIFEQYINDRAQMGAYYTKEDITEYIGKNCIIPFLMDKVAENYIEAFTPNGFVWETLHKSGDKYIYDAVKKGYSADWQKRIPENIARGIDTSVPNLLERRSEWNTRTSEQFALPTEIWRETIERLKRCDSILNKINNGEITHINDFITYNLDIRSFVYDLIHSTKDHLFVLNFCKALQTVTILDPTCGSGAFLFAAMNILEPLYEVCIERMQEFNAENPELFKVELEEISNKYRSNIQYYIYKSIILRNLYGVDIMVEATEIAKLRLFLKMVAVVEVDKRAENLGLDPLPDIDFNIRCGNTLVGYATEEELNNDLASGDMFANQEFREKIENELNSVSDAYNLFKKVQLKQEEDLVAFKKAKFELKKRMQILNEMLNKRMHAATSISYDKWLETHQPFHWLAEFYQIIKGNGGFDVIIGNPPYVVYTKKNKDTHTAVSDVYVVNCYTRQCNNLYAFCIERSYKLASKKSSVGMIVPISAFSNNNMVSLQKLMRVNFKNIYISTYHQRPAQLFVGVLQRLSIFISNNYNTTNSTIYTTGVTRWNAESRDILFNLLNYHSYSQELQSHFLKINTPIEVGIINKMSTNIKINSYLSSVYENNEIFYRSAGGGYWITILNKPFDSATTSNRQISFKKEYKAKVFSALLNSNLFWWFYSINYDLFNFTESWMFSIYFTYPSSEVIINKLNMISDELELSLRSNAHYYVINSKTNGAQNTVNYKKIYSKDVMDKIDSILMEHYNFTEEELDFIINYDIKYRMGDELNE